MRREPILAFTTEAASLPLKQNNPRFWFWP
jgi:hypothetical protein